MSDEAEREQSGRYLDYLSIAFWVYAGYSAICCCAPGLTLPVGLGLLFDSHDDESRVAGAVLIASGILASVGMLLYAAAMALNASLLSRRAGYPVVFGLSVLAVLNAPFGTLVGVLAIIALLRDSTRELFGRAPSA